MEKTDGLEGKKRVLDVLKEGRRRLVEAGWVQWRNVAENEDGRIVGYCAFGAVNQDREARELLENDLWKNLSTWNDQGHRTKEEVVALFDRVIQKLEVGT